MTILVKEIEIIPIQENTSEELGEDSYYNCAFCNKRTPASLGNLCEKLSKEYYCSFCLRHNFNTKNNKNVLLLSFHNIFDYYYQEFYLNPVSTTKKMYLSEIQAYVKSHMQVGLLNPTFSYDTSTFLWFVDFSKIGRGNKKIKIKDVLRTIVNILACFNLKSNMPEFSVSEFYEKYDTAINKFYSLRYRPANKIILSPSVPSSKDNSELFTID